MVGSIDSILRIHTRTMMSIQKTENAPRVVVVGLLLQFLILVPPLVSGHTSEASAELCHGNYVTYYEEGGLGPSRWEFLPWIDDETGQDDDDDDRPTQPKPGENRGVLDLDGQPIMKKNQCGGTAGLSGFGQSPVTVDEETQSRPCDTDLSSYNFVLGDCRWEDLTFAITNNGMFIMMNLAPRFNCVFFCS